MMDIVNIIDNEGKSWFVSMEHMFGLESLLLEMIGKVLKVDIIKYSIMENIYYLQTDSDMKTYGVSAIVATVCIIIFFGVGKFEKRKQLNIVTK